MFRQNCVSEVHTVHRWYWPPMETQHSFGSRRRPSRFAASYTYIYLYIYLARSDKLYFEASEGVGRRRRERSLFVFCIDAVLSCTLLRWKLTHCPFDCFQFSAHGFPPAQFQVPCIRVETEIYSKLWHEPDDKRGFSLKLPYCSSLRSVQNALCDIKYNVFLYLSLLEIVFKTVCRDRLENKLRVCKQTVQCYTPILYNNGFGQTVIIHLFRTESAHLCQRSWGTFQVSIEAVYKYLPWM